MDERERERQREHACGMHIHVNECLGVLERLGEGDGVKKLAIAVYWGVACSCDVAFAIDKKSMGGLCSRSEGKENGGSNLPEGMVHPAGARGMIYPAKAITWCKDRMWK
jgi:hypothetical protein